MAGDSVQVRLSAETGSQLLGSEAVEVLRAFMSDARVSLVAPQLMQRHSRQDDRLTLFREIERFLATHLDMARGSD